MQEICVVNKRILQRLLGLLGCMLILLNIVVAEEQYTAPMMVVPKDYSDETKAYRLLTKYLLDVRDRVVIPCKATSASEIILQWKKNGEWQNVPMPKFHRLNRPDRVSEFKVGDSALYRCIAPGRRGTAVSYTYDVRMLPTSLGATRDYTDLPLAGNPLVFNKIVLLRCGHNESLIHELSQFMQFKWYYINETKGTNEPWPKPIPKEDLVQMHRHVKILSGNSGRTMLVHKSRRSPVYDKDGLFVYAEGWGLRWSYVCGTNGTSDSEGVLLPPKYYTKWSDPLNRTYEKQTGNVTRPEKMRRDAERVRRYYRNGYRTNATYWTTPSPVKFAIPPYEIPEPEILCIQDLNRKYRAWEVKLAGEAAGKVYFHHSEDDYFDDNTRRIHISYDGRFRVRSLDNITKRSNYLSFRLYKNMSYSGSYTCLAKPDERAENRTISVTTIFYPRWKDQAKPGVVIMRNEDVVEPAQYVDNGDKLELICDVLYAEANEITWLMNGIELPLVGPKVSIEAGKNRSGTFSCIAKNEVGELRGWGSLLLRDTDASRSWFLWILVIICIEGLLLAILILLSMWIKFRRAVRYRRVTSKKRWKERPKRKPKRRRGRGVK